MYIKVNSIFNKRILNKNGIEYFLLFGLLAISGMPFFSGSDTNVIILFFLALIVFVYRGRKISRHFLYVILTFLIVEFIQILIHHSFTFRTFVGTYVKLAMVFFIVSVLRHDFSRKYVNIIYFFSIISLIFYSLSFIPGFTQFFLQNVTPIFSYPYQEEIPFYDRAQNIIIFTFEKSLWIDFRNSGPFWEPGGFAVFLVIALIINIIRTKNLIEKKNIIFSICILTTISTAGYIALFLVIAFYLYNSRNISKYVYIALLVFISIFLYTHFEFLGEKINGNIEAANITTSSRFGSMLVDFNDFRNSPFVGWGRGEMRYGGREYNRFTQDEHRNNGIFGLLATYGIFLTIIYFFWYYQSFRKCTTFFNFRNPNQFAVYFLIVILTLGFSQSLFFRPFFYSFFFYFSLFPQNYFKKCKT